MPENDNKNRETPEDAVESPEQLVSVPESLWDGKFAVLYGPAPGTPLARALSNGDDGAEENACDEEETADDGQQDGAVHDAD